MEQGVQLFLLGHHGNREVAVLLELLTSAALPHAIVPEHHAVDVVQDRLDFAPESLLLHFGVEVVVVAVELHLLSVLPDHFLEVNQDNLDLKVDEIVKAVANGFGNLYVVAPVDVLPDILAKVLFEYLPQVLI